MRVVQKGLGTSVDLVPDLRGIDFTYVCRDERKYYFALEVGSWGGQRFITSRQRAKMLSPNPKA